MILKLGPMVHRSNAAPRGEATIRVESPARSTDLELGRVTPCAPHEAAEPPNGAHGATRPTCSGKLEFKLQLVSVEPAKARTPAFRADSAVRAPILGRASFILAIALSLAAAFPIRAGTNSLPPHPRLLLDTNGIAELKQRIANAPWASTSWEELKAGADKTLSEAMSLPPRGGNWGHNYVCPIHGARLTRGRKISPWQWEHECPVGPHILRGDPSKGTLDFDGNVMMAIHEAYASETANQGLVYQVTGDARHAKRAHDILLAYANRYLSYPVHDNQGRPGGRGGHVASQSLTEATWLIDIAQGADLVWNTLTDADRRAITEKILRPALAEIILPQKYGIHNIQCRQNSAIGLVGFLIGDDKLIHTAIDDPRYGYRQQMEKGVLADGMWTEGSSGYHFFTIEGLWPLTEAARNCGVNLYGPKLGSMFNGPLSLAMPNLSLPNFNDSGVVALPGRADSYELAFARYRDPDYLRLLARSDRAGRLALLFGVPNLPKENEAAAPGSRNLPASGYSILQQGQGTNATWLCVKYGPHGGWHGHPDKNNFILCAGGEIVAPDAGTHAYGSPLHDGWDKTTLAHNTLVVDEKSQEPTNGNCIAFGSDHGADYSVTDAGPIYKGVRFTRTAALLTPQLIVFVDQIQADAPHTFDLAYHQTGVWEDLPPGKPWTAPSVAGYKYFTRTATRTNGADGLTLKTTNDGRVHPAITLAGGEPTEVITGCGILKTTEDLVPMVVQRRRAQQTAFVWAVSLDGSPVTLLTLDVKSASGKRFDRSRATLVQVSDGEQRWALLANPQREKVVATLPDGSAWPSDAAFAVR